MTFLLNIIKLLNQLSFKPFKITTSDIHFFSQKYFKFDEFGGEFDRVMKYDG